VYFGSASGYPHSVRYSLSIYLYTVYWH
jgi:hypothetical protein